jgi:two-component system, cell cycle response regulator
MRDAQGGRGEGERRGKVLIVDDSRVVRAVVAGFLKQAQLDVEEAADGEAGLAMLAKGQHDVVITDLNMPGLDGFGVLAAAKKAFPNVEVIILTGAHSDDMTAAVRALRLGAHDYLIKPPDRAEEVVLAVERALEKKRLKDMNRMLLEQLEALSLTDALTGVPNRRALERALERETARAHRHKLPLGFVMLDIDHFKKINDAMGHDGGDEVLRSFAATVSRVLRKGDAMYRYGGEEFVVLLAHADAAGGRIAAERFLAAVRSASVKVGCKTVQITASAGVSSLGAGSDGPAALSLADAALYEAKRSGRDRVCVSGAAG